MLGPPEVSELEAASWVPSFERADASRPFGADVPFTGLDPGCLRARFWLNPSSQAEYFTSRSLDFPIKKVGAVTASLTGLLRRLAEGSCLSSQHTGRCFEQR